MSKKRKEITDLILKVYRQLQPSGKNAERYKEYLSGMTDEEFGKFIKRLESGEEQLSLYVPNMNGDPIDVHDVYKAADTVGVNFFERVWLIDPATGKKYLTNREYAIFPGYIRRLRQYIMSKMATPVSDKTVNSLTGQVMGPDKTASFTYPEMQSLMAKNMTESIKELAKIRGGDVAAYQEVRQQLEDTGEASMSGVGEDTRAKSADVLASLLLACHIDNNL